MKGLKTDMYISESNLEFMAYLKWESWWTSNSSNFFHKRGIMESPLHLDYGDIYSTFLNSPYFLMILASNMRVLTIRSI